MNSSLIISSINKHISLSPEEENYFLSSFVFQTVRHGEFIERNGEQSRNFIFVNTGCLMTYFTDPQGNDHVAQFATSGWWTGDLHSFMKSEPSIFSTRALIDSEILLITKNGLDNLLEKYPKFERYFRILFQNSLVTQQNRIMQGFSSTAEERYQQFKEKYPPLEQYVPLKYIASYLGITPEFLSKIRRRLMES